ncbi:chascon isoform d-related [Anaeramoeba flamelloides]|uniref:Chascon isoform d-related n=1 Tax=Anaeramoeba flamelloides TaxID=1746091 RepID=A0AAV7ZAS2_9EUKA|nr:chascon isoform d-related [Anaeramoeba flamelloides]
MSQNKFHFKRCKMCKSKKANLFFVFVDVKCDLNQKTNLLRQKAPIFQIHLCKQCSLFFGNETIKKRINKRKVEFCLSLVKHELLSKTKFTNLKDQTAKTTKRNEKGKKNENLIIKKSDPTNYNLIINNNPEREKRKKEMETKLRKQINLERKKQRERERKLEREREREMEIEMERERERERKRKKLREKEKEKEKERERERKREREKKKKKKNKGNKKNKKKKRKGRFKKKERPKFTLIIDQNGKSQIKDPRVATDQQILTLKTSVVSAKESQFIIKKIITLLGGNKVNKQTVRYLKSSSPNKTERIRRWETTPHFSQKKLPATNNYNADLKKKNSHINTGPKNRQTQQEGKEEQSQESLFRIKNLDTQNQQFLEKYYFSSRIIDKKSHENNLQSLLKDVLQSNTLNPNNNRKPTKGGMKIQPIKHQNSQIESFYKKQINLSFKIEDLFRYRQRLLQLIEKLPFNKIIILEQSLKNITNLIQESVQLLENLLRNYQKNTKEKIKQLKLTLRRPKNEIESDQDEKPVALFDLEDYKKIFGSPTSSKLKQKQKKPSKIARNLIDGQSNINVQQYKNDGYLKKNGNDNGNWHDNNDDFGFDNQIDIDSDGENNGYYNNQNIDDDIKIDDDEDDDDDDKDDDNDGIENINIEKKQEHQTWEGMDLENENFHDKYLSLHSKSNNFTNIDESLNFSKQDESSNWNSTTNKNYFLDSWIPNNLKKKN